MPVAGLSKQTHIVSPEEADLTIAALLRRLYPELSWSRVRRIINSRRVRVDGDLCLDDARRLRAGAHLDILDRPLPLPPSEEQIVVRFLDDHLVVVEKPAGINTVRHPAERFWPERRKVLSPALVDLVSRQLASTESSRRRNLPRLRIVHRLDKETSGLVVFARTVAAEQSLGRQFHAHTVLRRYLAIVPGKVDSQTIESRLVRDRGDGRRGSGAIADTGKHAVTHVEVEERLPGYTLLSCRLETGRTHQIRIHLAELGHPVCGEKVYNRRLGQPPTEDASAAPRTALHAVELGFQHPLTGSAMHWSMPLPMDLRQFLDRLRASAATSQGGSSGSEKKGLHGHPHSRGIAGQSSQADADGNQVDG